MTITSIALNIPSHTVVGKDEVRLVLDDALRHEAELAGARRSYFEDACRGFEETHQMSSDEFMERFEAGELGDAADYFDWYAAKRGLSLWTRRAHILSEITV